MHIWLEDMEVWMLITSKPSYKVPLEFNGNIRLYSTSRAQAITAKRIQKQGKPFVFQLIYLN